MGLRMAKIIFFFAMLASSYAYAAAPTYMWSSDGVAGTYVFSSALDACKSKANGGSTVGWTVTPYGAQGQFGQCYLNGNPAGNVTRDVSPSCPANSTYNSVTGQCSDPPCPFGQMYVDGVCAPIPCPAGTSYQRDTINTALEIYRCLDNCPSNTVTNLNPVTHIQICGIADIKTPETSDSSTCPETKVQIGFDGSGKAICMNSAGKDPCPIGTHNISADIDAPNCTSNSPSPPSTVSETKNPTETKTNTDGSIEKKDKTETTYPDGSKQTTTTTTTTSTNGGVTTTTTSQCSREGGCGGSNGTGGSGSGTGNGNGNGTGDDKVDNPVQQAGDLYTKKEKTFSQVLTDFNNTVKASPFISAANAYFTVSVGGGACPSWKATVPYLNMVVDTGQFFCTSLMSSVFGIIAAGLMMAASYVAFRWAFL